MNTVSLWCESENRPMMRVWIVFCVSNNRLPLESVMRVRELVNMQKKCDLDCLYTTQNTVHRLYYE